MKGIDNERQQKSDGTKEEQDDQSVKSKTIPSTMDWRRRQNITNSIQMPSSDDMIRRLGEREHAPGVRSPGCPCCDPDNVSNVLEGMMF